MAGPSKSLLLAYQSLSLHTSAPLLATGNNASKRRYDPYAVAKAKVRKEKNIARQVVLQKERDSTASDPVWGHPTEFAEILDQRPSALPPVDRLERKKLSIQESRELAEGNRLNHFLGRDELEVFLKHSKELAYPPPDPGVPIDREREKIQNANHAHSVAAILRITSLGLGSAKDKTRENKQLCVATFGRHVTDNTLPPDHIPEGQIEQKKQFEKTPRVGPDTGSSEVQAAILTAKIRALAEHTKNNKKDKMNKRNLRLLCHKRQKILRYLKRKEKGGVRYRNIMEQLGLDERAIEMELMM